MSYVLGNIVKQAVISVNVGTLTSCATVTTAEQTVTVLGLMLGDKVSVEKPTHQAGLGISGARVSAADTLSIQFVNPTAGAIVPTANEIYKVLVSRPDRTITDGHF